MPAYVVFSKLSATGYRAAKEDPDRMADLATRVEEVGGTIVEQYALSGPHDFCTIVNVRDNDTAHLLKVIQGARDDAVHSIAPAIDLPLFVRLLGQSTENTGPYRWQISLPARVVRRLLERYAYTAQIRKYFKPLDVIGQEHFDGLGRQAVFIANHSSFMDTAAMYAVLPARYRHRTAWPAAADRFFIKGRRDFRKQGWWFSLVYNSFPLKRGGGRASLAHADWLIEKGWSIGIFPEGARTSAGRLARFRVGPAMLAVRHGIPVVPMYLEGLAAIRAKGSQQMTPGAVKVRVGPPLRFSAGTDVSEATHKLHRAVQALADEAANERRAARGALQVTASEAASPGG